MCFTRKRKKKINKKYLKSPKIYPEPNVLQEISVQKKQKENENKKK